MNKHFWMNYSPECDFPIQNLPYGVFHLKSESYTNARVGVAIGDYVLDLSAIEKSGLFKISGLPEGVFSKPCLNDFMSLGRPIWRLVRERITSILNGQDNCLIGNVSLSEKCLIVRSDVSLLVPAKIGDYTDFYSSKEHATNLGKLFRPNGAPLLENWIWIPVGYHGRASSVVESGRSFKRPCGQIKPKDSPSPVFGESQKLDFELEMAFFVGPGNQLGEPIEISKADDHIFGVVLMNDWSARDLQSWEYVPLGPFTGKNFITSISPWVVTLDALAPFSVKPPTPDVPYLPYLSDPNPNGAYDINLQVQILTKNDETPQILSNTNFKYMYWTMRQQLVHHSIAGCNLNPGDLLGSGTISGPNPGSCGSIIELTKNGTNLIKLSNGEERSFLQDGDTILMTGYCQGNQYRIGFGEVSGTVIPSILHKY